MNDRDYVEAALEAWASSYPRTVTRIQKWAYEKETALDLLMDAERDEDNSPFISTYSFPDGHTKDNNIPRIDRLFIDFDVPASGEYRSGAEREDAWIRDMSKLLVRVRKVAGLIVSTGSEWTWQAALSGHKGVHLDLTFSPISTSNGTYQQFRGGMRSYADLIEDYLIEKTNLSDLDTYIDVSSADLGRMRRVPNTLHGGATESFGEDRFCVPVTISELSKIKPADYIALTQSRRPVTSSMRATPNEEAGKKLIQQIRTATGSESDRLFAGSSVDRNRISEYENNENGRLSVDDLGFVMNHRPCVEAFVDRDDAFDYGAASHLMEMKAVTEMMEQNVPIDVMIEFFSQANGFRERYTRGRIEQYISRSYDPVSCQKIWDEAPQFCVESDCRIWIDEQAQ
jgi:hypothetical protein